MRKSLVYFGIAVISFFCAAEAFCQPFPALIAGWSAAEKQQQRDAGEKLLKDLAAAIKSGKKEFNITKGNYRFSKTVNKRPTHINLSGVKNFTLEGNNSSLFFENFSTGLQVYKSENVKIKNLIFDWDPIPFTQGKVVSIDHKANTFIFKPDAGYDKLYDRLFKSSQNRGMLFDAKTRKLKAGQRGFCLQIVKKLDNGSYVTKVRGFYGYKAKKCGFEVGDLIVMLARMGRAVKTEVSSNIKYENITLYASPFVCFVESVGKGGNVYKNCKIIKRPETDRLIAGNADGFNSSNALKGPTLDGCEIENIGDDFVNFHGVYYRIFEQKSPTELIVQPFGSNGMEKPVISFLENKTWNFLGQRTVIASKSLTYTVTESKQGEMRKWAAAANFKPGTKTRALSVKLDKAIDLKTVAIFSTNTATANNAVIKNCKFSGSLARGIRLQSENALIENNIVDTCLGPGLTTGGQPGFWGEAVTSKNLIIKNNSFIDCGIGGDGRLAGAVMFNAPGEIGKAEAASNIIFSGNKIIRPGDSALLLDVCKDVKVTNNIFSQVGQNPPHNDNKKVAPVLVKGVENVKFENNKFDQLGKYASKPNIERQK